jgi:cytochrome P450 family 110
MARSSLPDGPRLSWLQGWYFLHRSRDYSAWLRRRYRDIVTLRLPPFTAVVVLTPEGARQVLTADPDGYDAFFKSGFAALAGSGSIWVLDGQRHRRERQLLLPAFHARRIRFHGQAIKDVALSHTDAWRAGEDMRAYDAMLDISRDVILRIVFGVEDGEVLDEGRRLLSILLHAVRPSICFIPLCQSSWFPPWTRFQRAKQEFSMFIARRKAERSGSGTEAQDLLGLLLAARFDDGTALSDDEIRDELLTVLLSGHETTAVALSWAVYELGRHPAVLARLREELDALGPNPEPDLIVKQPYLGAVCDETLRLRPVLTEVGRVTRASVPLLGHAVPAGVGVAVSISAIHQDPSTYPQPDQFRPERFIERTYSPFEFLPFGGGHRRCPGAHLSDCEMRIALAVIVTRWDFEIVGEEKEIRHNIGTGPKHGVRMWVTGRRRIAAPSRAVFALAE